MKGMVTIMADSTIYIDFHSHILPGADHGAETSEDSTASMNELIGLGAGGAVATPHFYPENTSVELFKKRRASAVEHFKGTCLSERCPVYVGAEVAVCRYLERMPELSELCIAGTNVLLLEMPFVRWTEEIIKTVESIRKLGFEVILAHPDRYEERGVEALFERGFRGQLNIASLATKNSWRRRRLLRWVDDGHILAIGTDIHRPEVRDDRNAFPRGIEVLGEDRLEMLKKSTSELLNGANELSR